MKRIVLVTLLAMLPILSACNTMEGLGQDTQKAGQKLENSADKNKQSFTVAGIGYARVKHLMWVAM